MKQRILIQGFLGCFHQEAAEKYFSDTDLQIIPAESFLQLADELKNNLDVDFAMMAIENNIAGSIVQNYKILREYRFRIIGEIYLPIHHNLMCLPGQAMSNISEVHSHPMALNQCLAFLSKYPQIKMVESKDTALSALQIREKNLKGIAAIASLSASELYNLDILERNIETSPNNYTRFFALQRDGLEIPEGKFNKASIYLTTDHAKGSLLRVLEVIYDNNINLTKLQSYPVEGQRDAYYFYLDLDFKKPIDYERTIELLKGVTLELEVLGVYSKYAV